MIFLGQGCKLGQPYAFQWSRTVRHATDLQNHIYALDDELWGCVWEIGLGVSLEGMSGGDLGFYLVEMEMCGSSCI